MLLEKGITGFFEYGDPFIPELDYASFQRMCYAVRDRQWQMTGIFCPDHTNYFYAHFQGCYSTGETERQEVYILQNKYYPIVAMTKELSLYEKVFIDITDPFLPFIDGELISAEILNEAFHDSQHHLSDAELQQIRYWKPVSIGNIIFNEWD